jgi:hypothetical protein
MMKENFRNNLIMGEKLDNEKSAEIIKKLKEKYPNAEISEDIEHFIIKKDKSEITFLKRKFLPTIHPDMPKLNIEEILEAEINFPNEASVKEKIEKLREKDKKEAN